MGRMGTFFKDSWALLKETFKEFNARDPFRNSAVIAYFAIFSMPGLLIIVINVAGYFMGQDTLQATVSGQVTELIGSQAAEDIDRIVANAQSEDNTTLANIISLATLIFGATGIFYHLQTALNIMWGVEPEPERRLLKVLKDRLFSFGMILVAGFLMVVSLLVSSLLAAFSDWISRNVFTGADVFFQLLEVILSLAVLTVMFAAMFKFLPDAIIQWKDVWVGAFVTTLLFMLAKYALSLYFGEAEPGSMYGAAGSIVLIMLWVTYTGLILLFGAEFTRTYADRHGTRIRLPDHARWRTGRGRDNNGQ
jgi:membrane protein